MRSLTFFDVDENFNMENFPLGDEKCFFDQLFKETSPTTSITLVGNERVNIEKDGNVYYFNKFDVIHEMPRKTWGRVGKTEFKHFFEKVRLEFWVDLNNYLGIGVGKSAACTQVIKKVEEFNLKEKYLDVRELKYRLSMKQIGEIKGALFRNLQLKNVDTAMIYGSSLDESEEYEKYDSVGELTALVVTINTDENIAETIRISNKWSMILYSNLSTDREYIEKALEYKSWIDQLMNMEI